MDVSRPTAQAVMPAPLPGRPMSSMPPPTTSSASATSPAATNIVSPAARPAQSAEPVRSVKTRFDPPLEVNSGLRELASLQELVEASQQATEKLRELGRNMSISVDPSTSSVVVTLTDKSGSFVRQIPSSEKLKIERSIDRLTGILVDKKV